jgi:beta-galactosidase
MSFPPDFKFGWSQSGFQSEMGFPNSEDPNSDWYVWVHDPENIVSGLVSGDLPENGPGYWDNYRSFHDSAQEMGLKIARINVEWSRIFPKPTYEVKVDVEVKGDKVLYVDVKESALKKLDSIANIKAVEHYREIFGDLKKREFTFMLNLYHWTLPLWIHDPIAVRGGKETEKSGWLSKRTVVEFAKFAAFVAWKLNDLVDIYSTMCEPNVVWRNGFIRIKSGFPPSYLNMNNAVRAMHNMIEAHARAYDVLKAHKKPVGIIYANRDIIPLSEADKEAAEKAEFSERWRFFDAIMHGTIDSEAREDLKRKIDWIGINYYSRSVVKAIREGYMEVEGYGHNCERNSLSLAGRPTSDFGWEFYPEGLYNLIMKYWRRYGLPIYVTENGIADEADYQRPYYLVTHLYQISKAIKDGAEVKGYLHWSLADNYEWSSGFKMRFGLLHVDYSTKRLYWRPSAFIYKEIVENQKITERIEHLNTIPPVHPLRR